MRYKFIFLVILASSVVFFSTLINDVKLFLILLLIIYLMLYSLINPYFNRKIQKNLNTILYLGFCVFLVIVIQKVLEILNR